MDTLKYHGKAVIAFVALVLTNLLMNYASGSTPLPLDSTGHQLDWFKLLVNVISVVGGTTGVHQFTNGPKPVAKAKPRKHTAKHAAHIDVPPANMTTAKVEGADSAHDQT